ncbi:MAG: helix-turn-helix transcriptional regulator [Eubacteriales bacterium]
MGYNGLVVGQAIRDLRINKKLTIEELSYRANVSASHMNQIELGSRKMSMALLFEIMDVLETDANTILAIEHRATGSESYSIEKELATLSEKEQIYLEGVFGYMIGNIKKNIPL